MKNNETQVLCKLDTACVGCGNPMSMVLELSHYSPGQRLDYIDPRCLRKLEGCLVEQFFPTFANVVLCSIPAAAVRK